MFEYAAVVVGPYNPDSERLYLAPLNSAGRPPGPGGKEYHGRQLVLARLVWPRYSEVVPAEAVWREQGRVCVEWEPRRGAPRRRTWLRAEDVRPRVRSDDED